MNRIIILGGMGPQASLELHRRIIAGACARGARDNEDFPEIVHLSVPIPDFISSGDSSEGLRQLTQALMSVRIHSDDQLVLACNTAHLLLPQLEETVGKRFVSLISATTEAVVQDQGKTIGLLASPTTIQSGLYTNPLTAAGKEVITPHAKEMERLEHAIRFVIAGGNPNKMRRVVRPIIDRMERSGADKVILGCTELSVIFSGVEGAKLVDPLEEIGKRILKG